MYILVCIIYIIYLIYICVRIYLNICIIIYIISINIFNPWHSKWWNPDANMKKWKQSALPITTAVAFWQLMHLGTWCWFAEVHELPWGHWWNGDNWGGKLSVFLTTNIYLTHLLFAGFENSVFQESFLTIILCIYAKGRKNLITVTETAIST